MRIQEILDATSAEIVKRQTEIQKRSAQRLSAQAKISDLKTKPLTQERLTKVDTSVE
jgi:hypothetical protein